MNTLGNNTKFDGKMIGQRSRWQDHRFQYGWRLVHGRVPWRYTDTSSEWTFQNTKKRM